MSRTRILIFLLVVAWASVSLWAQRAGGTRSTASPNPEGMKDAPVFLSPTHFSYAEDEDRVVFHSQTMLVQFPAIVTDKSGNHVRGLTKGDFVVFENGKQREIATFEEVVSTNSRISQIAPKPGEFSNLVLEGESARSINIIALDSVNTPLLDQTYGRRELIKYLADNLDSGQVQALVIISPSGLRVIHGLTDDPAQLAQALKRISTEFSTLQGVGVESRAAQVTGDIPSAQDVINLVVLGDIEGALRAFEIRGDAPVAEFKQEQAIEVTMRAFLAIAWSVHGIPGRKSLIWATGGFPFILDSASTVPGGRLSSLYERTMVALNDAQVSVYPVDIRGLVNSLPTVDNTAKHQPKGADALRQLVNRTWLQSSTTDTLRDFAAMTGGRAFYNTNEIEGSFKHAAEDSSSYYLVGYYLDTKNTKPGWRQLKVKVQKPHLEVRTRGGFFVTNAAFNPEVARKSDMDFALHSPFECTGIPVTLRWEKVSGDGDKRKVAFALHMPGNRVTFEPDAEQSRVSLDFAALATKSGGSASSMGDTLQGALPSSTVDALKVQGVGYKNTILLAPGQYEVRFVVRDNLSGKVGSVSAPLTVN